MSENYVAENYFILCLGDSYTIGQSVQTNERFPEQTINLLKEKKIYFNDPVIVARTGWTSDDLIDAIQQKSLQQKFDFVTLLIGVNDQFQGVDENTYSKNFEQLLNTSIQFVNGNAPHVFVLSIPDYGVTPFAKHGKGSINEISNEIDEFNLINEIISEKYDVHYIDITEISRKAGNDLSLLASDGLHPSVEMYSSWSYILANEIASILSK